jgi:hypothetical protein
VQIKRTEEEREMTCKKCNGTGWIIKRVRMSAMSNALIQSRCDCDIWTFNCDTLKYEKNLNYVKEQRRNGE